MSSSKKFILLDEYIYIEPKGKNEMNISKKESISKSKKDDAKKDDCTDKDDDIFIDSDKSLTSSSSMESFDSWDDSNIDKLKDNERKRARLMFKKKYNDKIKSSY